MERKKIVAIVTGIVSVLLGVVYLILVELLDSRGAMIPAPINDVSLLLSWLFSSHFYL
ncbi:hypothetical protein VKI21_16450 [Cyanobacterium aponinum UTEX 3222]|uniref:Glucose-inhibited division protein A n=2 Tax=Cyanobacterium aponinum TaxID=379064 RepID=K9Z2X6_CYAAP|nr:hypothetical protein [Cyanobacterium aponinum]WRL41620.1 hypothetical protein VKI21_16450 [Cyanobacterium aponinum UTEX 3222]AFZ53509.1 hypothetical protein Cyan10605_1397 [Cyanobacterium aponinum PCC 10605]MBD2393378.1 hypothetical protein [Cyanobacterium aponinum FACHB-4101]WPF89811.1 hypothetical protein SAY89_05945 [Cyanobacterium aponinum AL20115]WRL37900.1 hypothetical protein VKI22_14950 [Cyanobacterium aponinum UTEX 3221]